MRLESFQQKWKVAPETPDLFELLNIFLKF